jgi:hypothetical protein
MSVDFEEWGSISPLRYDLDAGGGGEHVDPTDEIEVERHASQEELEYESYAESSMTIPGQGEPGTNCQTWAPFEFCDECGEPKMGMNHCEKRVCPNCYRRWEHERTEGGVGRLGKARYAEDAGIDRRAVHAVMSPPPGEIRTLTQWYRAYKKAYELAQEQGIRGGVVIAHGFRVNDDVKQRYPTEYTGGIWKWIREELPQNWRRNTYWSPHFHVLGLCRDMEANHPSQQDGWNAVRIRSLKPFARTTDKEGMDSMISAFRYLLDHGTFETDSTRDCVRWFGSLSTRNFQPSEELSEGAESAIERLVDETLGQHQKDGDGDSQEIPWVPEPEQCDNCGSTSFSSIFEAGGALLDQGWCERIGREQERRLRTAFEWAIGDNIPPPGLKDPQTEEEADEAFEELL